MISHRIKIPYKLVFIYILQYIYEKCLYIGDGVTKKMEFFIRDGRAYFPFISLGLKQRMIGFGFATQSWC